MNAYNEGDRAVLIHPRPHTFAYATRRLGRWYCDATPTDDAHTHGDAYEGQDFAVYVRPVDTPSPSESDDARVIRTAASLIGNSTDIPGGDYARGVADLAALLLGVPADDEWFIRILRAMNGARR